MFELEIISLCTKAIKLLVPEKPKIRFRPMNRKKSVNPKRSFVIGRTNLKTGLITIDIYTPVKREPKKVSQILRTLCHEIAHHQKPPFRQRFRRKWIIRAHYPEFYQQVQKNWEKVKLDLWQQKN